MSSKRMMKTVFAAIALVAAASAQAEDFVVDASASGCGEDSFFCTIQDAIDAAFAAGGGQVVVMPGLYRENLLLRDQVKLRGEDDDGAFAVIEHVPGPAALVVCGNDVEIAGLTLRVAPGSATGVTLVDIANVEGVRLEEVTIDGGLNRNTVGIGVRGQAALTSLVRECTLKNLEVGLLAEDTPIRVTRSLFSDILRDAIYIRPALPAAKLAPAGEEDESGPDDEGETEGEEEEEAPEVGDDDDIEQSGFNRFRNIGGFEDGSGLSINPGDSFALRNTTGKPVLAQLNDWAVYTDAEIAQRISSSPPGAGAKQGPQAAIFVPYVGKSVVPGSIYARVSDAATLSPIAGASTRLMAGAVDTGLTPDFDEASALYSFTFLTPGSYSVRAAAPAYESAERAVSVLAGKIAGLELRLNAAALPPPVLQAATPPSPSFEPQPEISGFATQGTIVVLFNGAAELARVPAAADGKFRVMCPPLSPGVYTLTAVAVGANNALSPVSPPFRYEVLPLVIPEGEGTVEGTAEGIPEGSPEGLAEGEGTAEGEGLAEGEGTPEGEGEGQPKSESAAGCAGPNTGAAEGSGWAGDFLTAALVFAVLSGLQRHRCAQRREVPGLPSPSM